MNGSQVGRDTLLLLPGWAVVIFYAATLASLVLFGYGATQLIRKYRKGRSAPGGRPGVRRLLGAFGKVLGNVTVLRNDPYAGIAHLMLMWGFITLFLGTLVVLIDRDILRFVLPAWVFWKGAFYLGFSSLMDVSGLLLLVGALMMTVRRALFRLPQLDYSHAFRETAVRSTQRSEWVLLGFVVAIVFGGFLLEGVRLVINRPSFEIWSPAGWAVADGLAAAGMDPAAATASYPAIWWFHSLLSLAFIAWVPWSKGLHMVLGAVSLAWKNEDLMKNLPPSPVETSAGYRQIHDLSWNELVGLDACVRCGRCHEACPSHAAGLPLSPRDVLRELREYSRHAHRHGNGRQLAGDVIPRETLWSCITCGICSERCPLGFNHIPLIVQLRRALIDEGAVDEQLQQTLINLQRSGNAMGQSDRQRAKWTKDLPFTIPDARKQEVEYLWYVGDNASYDPRVQDVTRTVASLFHSAGLEVGILYEGERNSGNDVRRVGEEGLFEMLAEKNAQAIERASFRAIVTTDPHTLNTLRHEYAGIGRDIPVRHYTEVLLEQIVNGALRVGSLGGLRVTYHDPCYLARYNDIIEQPRALLRVIGAEIIEMPRKGREAHCCGAGGGRLWMEDLPAHGDRPAENRLKEAASLTAVETIVTACPKDIVMFQDAIKTTGLEGRFFVRDIAELVQLAVEAHVTEYQEKEN